MAIVRMRGLGSTSGRACESALPCHLSAVYRGMAIRRSRATAGFIGRRGEGAFLLEKPADERVCPVRFKVVCPLRFPLPKWCVHYERSGVSTMNALLNA